MNQLLIKHYHKKKQQEVQQQQQQQEEQHQQHQQHQRHLLLHGGESSKIYYHYVINYCDTHDDTTTTNKLSSVVGSRMNTFGRTIIPIEEANVQDLPLADCYGMLNSISTKLRLNEVRIFTGYIYIRSITMLITNSIHLNKLILDNIILLGTTTDWIDFQSLLIVLQNRLITDFHNVHFEEYVEEEEEQEEDHDDDERGDTTTTATGQEQIQANVALNLIRNTSRINNTNKSNNNIILLLAILSIAL